MRNRPGLFFGMASIIERRPRLLAAGYLVHLAGERRASPETVRLYRFWLGRFLEYLGDHRFGSLPDSPRQIGEFLRWLAIERRADAVKKRHLSPQLSDSALHKAYAVVRAFYGWMIDNGAGIANPFRRMKPPIVRPRRPAVAPKAAIVRLLRAIPGRQLAGAAFPRELGARDQALFAAMYFAGLRISEACRLRVQDLDLVGGFLTVHRGKGGRWRDLPVEPELAGYLRRWLRLRAGLLAHFGGDSEDLFITLPGRGRRRDCGLVAVDPARMNRLMRERYLPAARLGPGPGFPEKFTPHCLRHSVATRLVNLHVPLEHVQDILGHSTLEMTRHYVHLARHDIAEQHKKFSPMEGLLGRELLKKQPRNLPGMAAFGAPIAA